MNRNRGTENVTASGQMYPVLRALYTQWPAQNTKLSM